MGILLGFVWCPAAETARLAPSLDLKDRKIALEPRGVAGQGAALREAMAVKGYNL